MYDWRFENSINLGKTPIEVDSDYSQWRTNNMLSNHIDTIIHCNEMNMNYHITDKMHYDYMFNSVRKKKRFSKGLSKEEKKRKEEELELLTLIMNYYKYNSVRAKEALSVLNKEQIEYIKNKNKKGGVKNE